MLTTAGEPPSSGCPIPAIHDAGLSLRGEGSTDDNIRTCRINVVKLSSWEQGEEHRRFTPDHHCPTRRSIRRRQGFENVDAAEEIDFVAAI